MGYVSGVMDVIVGDEDGHTPLAHAIVNNKPHSAELLLDRWAIMHNVHKDIKIPDWMNAIINKRRNAKRSVVMLIRRCRCKSPST